MRSQGSGLAMERHDGAYLLHTTTALVQVLSKQVSMLIWRPRWLVPEVRPDPLCLIVLMADGKAEISTYVALSPTSHAIRRLPLLQMNEKLSRRGIGVC